MKHQPDFNDLMWQLAEAQDDAAIQEFIAKHPEHKAELLSRVGMVHGLKGSRPQHPKASKRFLPSPKTLSPEPPRLLSIGLVLFLLAAGVFATLGTLRFIESKNAAPTVITPDRLQPVRADNRPGLPDPDPGPPSQAPPPPTDNAVPPIREEDPFQRPVTIVAKNISLDAVLNDIAIQAGITLQSAPGMPESMVEIDYRETPAIQVLEALGRTFGFTALIQTSNSALLVPARDEHGEATPLPPGSVRESPRPPSGGGLTPLPGLNTDESQNNRTSR